MHALSAYFIGCGILIGTAVFIKFNPPPPPSTRVAPGYYRVVWMR